MESNWFEWVGKKAHIILNNGYEYNCLIKDCFYLDSVMFFSIVDKFKDNISFRCSEIKFIEEKK